MNKIFIIGNGFDLAHGLPTSYNHFIDNFWKNLKMKYEDEEVRKVVYVNESHYGFLNINNIDNFKDVVFNIKEHSQEYGYKYEDKAYEYYTDNSKFHLIFKFENDFFKTLNTYKLVFNWVDVENLYYSELKNIIKSIKLRGYQSDNDFLINKKELVKKLNLEFKQVRELFISYLKNDVVDKYDFNDKLKSGFWKSYYNILRPFSVFNDDKSKIFFEFTDKDDVDELQNLYVDQKEDSLFNTALFLCFNYTPTLNMYFSKMQGDRPEVKLNFIHNSIQNENDIIFGFGDEMDEDYKLIESIDDNEYLENFKSFKYLQYSNYNKLLDYINFNRFQVCILGHSCGLSDRVLLNTIFEHENCRSIKVYYHESGEKDNYTDIIQNISRHFNSKALMRERVVNKDYSSPMVQVQIPLKKS